MKTIKNISKRIFLLAVMVTVACQDPYNTDVDPSKTDYVKNPTTEETELDNWIFDNFTAPYNIEVKYRWDVSELDETKTLVPPIPSKTEEIMQVVKDVWIVPYIQEAGETFLKTYCPKQFVLVGSPNYNPGGTITLGTAEGGRKIVLFTINEFDENNRGVVKEQMHTVHHEFAHILHQNILYPNEFKTITPGEYTADWTNIPVAEAQSKGFITSYAMSAPDEDFVELIAMMLTEGRESFDRIVCAIPDANGQDIIRRKQQIVENYFVDSYDIVFSQLQTRTENAIDSYAPKSLLSDLGFQSGQNFNHILVDPEQLPEPLPSAFQTIYDNAANQLLAQNNLTLDNFSFYVDGFGYAWLEFIYHNNNNDQFSAVRYYELSADENDIFTLAYLQQDGAADVVIPALQPITDYFENQTLFLDWIPVDSPDCVVDLGGIYPQENPDAYCFGLLKN